MHNKNAASAMGLLEATAAAAAAAATELERACKDGDVAAVRRVLDRGAGPSGVGARFSGYINGMTPLHMAAYKGHVDVIALLLERGARIDAVTSVENETALHLAAYYERLDACSFLVERGADVDVLNGAGISALEYAVKRGNRPLIALLRAASVPFDVPAAVGVQLVQFGVGAETCRGFLFMPAASSVAGAGKNAALDALATVGDSVTSDAEKPPKKKPKKSKSKSSKRRRRKAAKEADAGGGSSDAAAVAPPRTCVVLAHGFSCLQTFEPIPTMVRALTARGFYCLTFDYRGFGTSKLPVRGSVRKTLPQFVDPYEHGRDWRAAVRYAAKLMRDEPAVSDVNAPANVCVWGTSFSGGHVVALCCRDEFGGGAPVVGTGGGSGGTAESAALAAAAASVPVRCAVSQVGCMDIQANESSSGCTKFGFARALAKWYLLGREITVCGLPHELALINGPEEREEILALAESNPERVHWRNSIPPLSVLKSWYYRPLDDAARVRCPVMYVSAELDDITPPRLIRAAAEASPNATYYEVPGRRHSEVYFGAVRDDIARREVEFFLQHCEGHTNTT